MEYGIPFSLVTPNGTLSINQSPSNLDGLYLSDVAGLDGGEVRMAVENLPQRDGAYVFDSLRGAMYPTLTGFIRAATLASRGTIMDTLKGYTDSIRTADGTLKFTPSGLAQRQLTVRLLAPVQIGNGGGILKTFQLQLVAGDPRVRIASGDSTAAVAALTGASGTFGFPFSLPFSFGNYSQGSVSITAGGNAPSWPVVTVQGPITGLTITNVTSGLFLSFPTLILAAGQSLVVDMYNETVLVGTASVIGKLDFTDSDFWSLAAGVANTVKIGGSSFTGATSASIAYRDTYI